MVTSWRNPFAAIVLSVVTAGAGLLVASPAHAQPVQSGSLAFSGDADDYITGGQSYSYTAGTDALTVFSNSENSEVFVVVQGANGDFWNLDLIAPAGQSLVPGTYPNATRPTGTGPGPNPGLNLDGNGRGCSTVTGSFTVTNAVYGPSGYVQTFDATFEQHCEGMAAAARGEIHIDNPPAPPLLELDLVVARSGTVNVVNRLVTISGTVTCDKPTTVSAFGNVEQATPAGLATGGYFVNVECTPGASVRWAGVADPNSLAPFVKGDADVEAHARAADPDVGVEIEVQTHAVVRLKNVRR